MASSSALVGQKRSLVGTGAEDGFTPSSGQLPASAGSTRPMSRLTHLGSYRRAAKEKGSNKPFNSNVSSTGGAAGEVLLSPTTWTQTLASVTSKTSSPPPPPPPLVTFNSRMTPPQIVMQARPAGAARRVRDDPFRTPSVSSKASTSRFSTSSPVFDPGAVDPMAVLQERVASHTPLFGEPARPRATDRGLRHRSSVSSTTSSLKSLASRRASSVALSPTSTDPLQTGGLLTSPAAQMRPSPGGTSAGGSDRRLSTYSYRDPERPFDRHRDPFLTPTPAFDDGASPLASARRASAVPPSSAPWSSDWSPTSLFAELRRPSAPQLHIDAPPESALGLGLSVRTASPAMTPFGASLSNYRFGAQNLDPSPGGGATRSPSRVTGRRLRSSDEYTRREDMIRIWKQWALEYKENIDEGRRFRPNADALETMEASAFSRALSSKSSFDSFLSSSGGTSRGRAGSRTSSARFPLLAGHLVEQPYSRGGDPAPSLVHLRALAVQPPSTVPSVSISPAPPTSNPFTNLRRRFAFRRRQSNVATQLLGEVLLSLEDYVAVYGRKVKVATAAIPAASSRSGSPNPLVSDPYTPLAAPSLDELDGFLSLDVDSPCLEELCEELDAVVRELIDVVPAFGTALTVGGYGPFALRREGHRSPGERFSAWAPHEDAGERWWAERLLRDLIEGLVGDDAAAGERFWAYYTAAGGGGLPLTKEEQVLTGALAALVEEDESGGGESARERELLEDGMRRWKEFQARSAA